MRKRRDQKLRDLLSQNAINKKIHFVNLGVIRLISILQLRTQTMHSYSYYYPPAYSYPYVSYSMPIDYPQINDQQALIVEEVQKKQQLLMRVKLLQQKCELLQEENQCLKLDLARKEKKIIKFDLSSSIQRQSPTLEDKKSIKRKGRSYKSNKIQKKRRGENQLVKNFQCPYQSCNRLYASCLALNLHMRVKHNGGTKKQRKQLLKAVIDAQLLGTEMPQININLPPNYIEEKKKILLGCQDFIKLGMVPFHH